MSPRPTVAWVTPVVPDAGDGGAHIREAYLVRAMAARADVHLVTSASVRDPDVAGCVASVTVVEPTPPRPGAVAAKGRAVRRLLSRHPGEVVALRADARRLVAAARAADVLVVGGAATGLAAIDLGRRPDWLHLHHLQSVKTRHIAAVSSGRAEWLARWDSVRATALERRISTGSRAVLVCAREDRDVLGTGVVIDNGVDTDVFAYTDPPERGTGVVFVGSFDYLPNIDGARLLLADILPVLRRLAPDVTVTLVGRRPPAQLVTLARDAGADVAADVPEVRSYLASAAVVVAPIRIGSGSRIKVLEAMAAGRPVVGTTIGLEGLEVVDGRHVVVADAPDDFAAAVAGLLGDPSRRREMARQARQLVEERYDWRAIAARFAERVISDHERNGR